MNRWWKAALSDLRWAWIKFRVVAKALKLARSRLNQRFDDVFKLQKLIDDNRGKVPLLFTVLAFWGAYGAITNSDAQNKLLCGTLMLISIFYAVGSSKRIAEAEAAIAALADAHAQALR